MQAFDPNLDREGEIGSLARGFADSFLCTAAVGMVERSIWSYPDPMKLFLSWSGPRSKRVAEVLSNWVPSIIQAVRPWMSTEMQKGARWQTEIAGRLEEAKFSIICLTRENLKAPWILFEAGAVSKSSTGNACTFLLDVAPNQVEFPLAQFQHTSFTRDDVKRLIDTVNGRLEEGALPPEILKRAFDTYWPQLQSELNAIVDAPDESVASAPRTIQEMTEEILQVVRVLARQKSTETITIPNVGIPLFEGLIGSMEHPATWPSGGNAKDASALNSMIGTAQILKYLAQLREEERKEERIQPDNSEGLTPDTI